MIRAVFFDLDGTLFDRDATVARVLDEQHRAFASELAAVRREDFVGRVAALDDHGHRDKSEVYATIATEFQFSSILAERLAADFWNRYHRNCKAFPGLVETLEELRRRGKILGIITNGTRAVQDATIDALMIRGLMHAILVSEAEGIRKPSQEIFQRAATRVAMSPGECCFVGDHPDVDVAGAEAAGFRAIWKRTTYWSPRVAATTIEVLSDVLSYV